MIASSVAQRVVAEALGTCFLTTAVIGSGIAASRLSPDDLGLQLLQTSVATGAVLVALILAFGSVSAAFNPVVTILDALFGTVGRREAALLIVGQVAGAASGAVVANLMFGLDPISISENTRDAEGILLAEVVATAGLLMVIFGLLRSGRSGHVAFAVGGYIAAAFWFTASTSFANPALTLARTLSDTFAGIAPLAVPGFVAAQLGGAMIAAGLVTFLWPNQALVEDRQ